MLLINLKNLEKNVLKITNDGRRLIGVVKNNAYGCGLIQVSKKLISLGIDILFVNDFREAITLLNNNINVDIIIHNPLQVNEYAYLHKYHNLIITINSIEDCYLICRSGLDKIRCHLQIDTGMNRFGLKTLDEFNTAMKLLKSNNIIIEGIYTHFASLDNAFKQLSKFKKFVNQYPFPMVHCAASLTYPHINYGNCIRVGLSLYDINQVMSVITKPLAIRRIKAGETVGYDCMYAAEKDELIAILPIGYGNGYCRNFQGFKVYANNKFYPIVGKICMNHLFVRVDNNVTENSLFELTSENLPASKLARYLSCTNYEIYTNFKFSEVKYKE